MIKILRFVLMLFVVSLLLTGCAGSGKLLQKGKYDAAIDKSVKKLMKDPDNSDEIKTLKKAYLLANNNDLDKINKLKLLGQPDVWQDIYYAYKNLHERQKKILVLDDAVLEKINFNRKNYTDEMTEALKKAADYNYSEAVKLLGTGNKYDARKAYDLLRFVAENLGNYRGAEQLQNKALAEGTVNVIFYMENKSKTVLPEDYEEQILKISLKDLNRQWLNFDTRPVESTVYDYEIDLIIKEIDVSPERLTEQKYTDTKKFEDGWRYLFDENGRPVIDSAGHRVKVKKYKTLKAFVTKVDMLKSAKVKAVLDYYDANGQLLKTYPLMSEFVFEHHFARYEGDKEALSAKSAELIKSAPLPFPTDEEIIFDTSGDLKQKAYELIKKDRNYFQ